MRLLIFVILTLVLMSSTAYDQDRWPLGDGLVIQIIQLDYADADHLAAVLAPLLSPEGRIVAYSRTNSLIIKDRVSIVRRLVEIIKGPVDQDP